MPLLESVGGVIDGEQLERAADGFILGWGLVPLNSLGECGRIPTS
jgi:hypothetical protein